MAVMIMAQSLFHHANKLKQMHHLIVDECGCMKEFVCGIVNLVQILENAVQIFTRYPLLRTSHWFATYSVKKRNLFLDSTKYNPKPNMVWSRKLYHPTVGESSQQKMLSPPPSFLLYQRYYI
jgi:hypothetical protein